MLRPRVRAIVATGLAMFFLSLAGAPHRHKNGLEDLLLDEPSDSGVLVESDVENMPRDGAALAGFRLVDDGPCPACFPSDFVSALPAPRAVLPRLSGIAWHETRAGRNAPLVLWTEHPSRAPPLAA